MSEVQTVIRSANRIAQRLEGDIKKLCAELSDLADKVEAAGKAGHFVNYTKAVRRARKLIKEVRP
jgi:hypothetical protein